MPVSTSVHLSHCLARIIELAPKSILDVGCGFGTWGFLCRTYLDVFEERVQPADWRVRIDGIEYFEPYIQAHQRALYSAIHIGDIRDLAASVDHYELIICGDVIEHMDKQDGLGVLDTLYGKATRALLLNIPIGSGWDHPERHGNPAELHRSEWQPEDFAHFPGIMELWQFRFAGKYGSLFSRKDAPPEERCGGLVHLAEKVDGENRKDEAVALLREGLRHAPGHAEATLYLADLLLERGDVGGGIGALEAALEADPGFHYAALTLARVHAAQRQPDRALARLDALLGRADVSEELRAEAEALRETVIRAHG